MPDGAQLDGRRPLHGVADAGTIATLPNLISFARLCAVPVAVWLVVRHELKAAFFLFVAAGLSDALDGWLARRGAGSRLGAVLDPLADKALLVSMYVVLAAVGRLPDWLAIAVVFRDVLIVGGVMLMTVLGIGVVIAPLRISKINTALQIVLVALVLLMSGYALHGPALLVILVWSVAATTMVSGAAYVVGAVRG